MTIATTTLSQNKATGKTKPAFLPFFMKQFWAKAFVTASSVLQSSTKTTLPYRGGVTVQNSMSSSASSRVIGIDYPELVVFDLDACLWDQEMYEMRAMPSKTVQGDLNGRGRGVKGVYSGNDLIQLHDGSLTALQEHADNQYPGMKIALASSADTPFAVQIGRATLKLLEVLPGMTVWDLLMRDWDGQDVNQIGRQPPLSSNKAATHFPRIRSMTGIRYDKMLFFDDCNWGDHCGMVARACVESDTQQGVVGHRTPSGLRVADWRRGMELYANQHTL
jgi:magnesium-dependent phosphatase 1